jgi:predicted DNA-binding transcriptional regulator AlpA
MTDLLPKMRPPEAARYLGVSVSTLARMRVRGDGPPFAKAGPRLCVYDRQNLDAWLLSRTRRSTSDHLPGA